MPTGPNSQENNTGFANTVFEHWQHRDAALEEAERRREEDRIKTRGLYVCSGAVGTVGLAGLLLFTIPDTAPAPLADLEVLVCLDAHQTAVEEAGRTGQVQLVTVAGCEATVSPPQTTTIP